MTDLVVSTPHAYGLATYPPGASFGPRALQDYEFVWVIEGSARYWRGDDDSIAAPSGSLLLCLPGMPDRFQWDPIHRTRHGYFHFQIEDAPRDWPCQSEWPAVRLLPDNDVVRPLFRHLLAASGHAGPEQCRLSVALILTAFISGEMATGSIAHAAWPETVQQACAYIYRTLEDDLSSQVSLTQLAEVVSVTPEHLCRIFKMSIGHSPAETVRLARLDFAVGLLARTNFSISDISSLCGFATPYHFSRLFKSVYRRTPTDVRNDSRAGSPPPLPRLLHITNTDG